MTDWLTYQWEFEGQRASFRVDMQYWNLLPVLSYTQLIVVSAAPKSPTAKKFSPAEQYAFSLLRRKLVDKLSGPAIFVGSVWMDALRCLYFYTSETSMIQEMSQLCREQKGLTVVCSHGWESRFSTYYRFLYPDDKKLQSVENAAFIEAQRRHGEELSPLRRMELTLSFMNPEDRSHFLQHAPLCGLTPGQSYLGKSATHPDCCKVYGYASLELDSLNKLTSRAIDAAAPLDGLLQQVQL